MTIAIVGAGINGLVAAARLATAGRRVEVFEATDRLGGAGATIHPFGPDIDVDLGATVVPLAAASPALAALGLPVEWRHPQIPLAHIGEDASFLLRDLDATAASLGRDAARWRALFAPLVEDFEAVAAALLGPLPASPAALLRGRVSPAAYVSLLRGVGPTASSGLRTREAQDLFAGLAAHSGLPPTAPASTAFALLLGAAAHAVGWPMVRGGTARIADDVAALITDHGGRIHLGSRIETLESLPGAEAVLFDTSAQALARIAGPALSAEDRRRYLRRRPGPAASRVDFRLRGPVPWSDPRVAGAGTVHLGGAAAEVGRAMSRVSRGGRSARPFVLVTQPSEVDPGRVREGSSLLWAYAHVPWGTSRDASRAIEDEIERAAPGFRELILERHTLPPEGLERLDSALLGGDVAGGAMSLAGLVARPRVLDPYRVPGTGRRLYLASAAASPGGGFHGMSGWHSAGAVLEDLAD